MRIQTISVDYERKINLGDFNSAVVGIHIWAHLDEDDVPGEVYEQLWSEAKEQVKTQALPLMVKRQAKAQDVYAGLPVEAQQEIGSNGHGY